MPLRRTEGQPLAAKVRHRSGSSRRMADEFAAIALQLEREAEKPHKGPGRCGAGPFWGSERNAGQQRDICGRFHKKGVTVLVLVVLIIFLRIPEK